MSRKTTSKSKRTTYKNNFYLTILDRLKFKTKLDDIRKELNISKQQLNYYLRQLKKRGYIFNKGYGWWELTNQSKRTTKYDNFLSKDMIRGHAYTWTIKPSKLPEDWKDRLKIIKKKNINHKIVGAKDNTPRIKALGRKVWLCNNHLRIFDTEKSSYYGETAIQSRKNSFLQLLRIVGVVERKLGISLKPFEWEFRKEHYALIKNDLAIDLNNKGVILRIADEDGEWLLVDDSLSMGGELENVGKKAFQTNIPMQKWWNENKKDKFKTTNPEKIKNKFNEIDNNFLEVLNRVKKSSEIGINSELRIKQLQSNIRGLEETIYQLIETIKKK